MRKYLLTAIAFSAATLSFGQSSFKKNDIYLEGGGNGLFGSINYERRLTKQPGLGARVGIGFYVEKDFFLTIPVGINYLFRLKKDRSFIEAGASATWSSANGELFGSSQRSGSDQFVSFVPSIGFRRHTAKDLMWRISVTPVINRYGVVPWLGASIGKRF
jgi:hypothetical protein